MEDGEINRAYTTVDLGARIRVLKGDATGFAYCGELTEESLMVTADTASVVANSSPMSQPKSLAAVEVKNYYTIDVPWSNVGVDKKLPIIERTNKQIRDPISTTYGGKVLLDTQDEIFYSSTHKKRLLINSTIPNPFLLYPNHLGGIYEND